LGSYDVQRALINICELFPCRCQAEHGGHNAVQEATRHNDVTQAQQEYSAAILEQALNEYKYQKVDSNASEVGFGSTASMSVDFQIVDICTLLILSKLRF
jgi:hypothetical protein